MTFKSEQALNEGWMIDRDGEGPWRIRARPDRPDFASDEDAMTHVWERALEGSLYHVQAIRFADDDKMKLTQHGLKMVWNEEFSSEGWFLSTCYGTDDLYRLERNDEAAIFEDDQDAWSYVMKRIEDGSVSHARAFRFLEVVQPNEAELIIKHTDFAPIPPTPAAPSPR